MSEWVKSEDSEEWNNEDYGSIVKINNKYQALLPVIFSVGPFDTLQEIQRQVLLNYDIILKLAMNFSPEMLKYIESLRSEDQFKKEMKC